MLTIWVTLGAGVGSVLRYALDSVVKAKVPSRYPWGTFVINMTGAFVLGLLIGLRAHHGLSGDALAVFGVGLCGGYTTWSTLMWETIALADTKAAKVAVINLAASLGLGLLAAAAGLGLANL